MNKYSINITIAKTQGAKWTRLALHEKGAAKWQLSVNHSELACGNHSLSPGTPWQTDFIVAEEPDSSLPHEYIGPNYCESLDAIIPIIRKLPSNEIQRAIFILEEIIIKTINEKTEYWCRLSNLATPEQWCEAYLKVKGKWINDSN